MNESVHVLPYRIMTAGQVTLGGEKIERLSIISAAYMLEKARIKKKQLEEIKCSSKSVL